MQETVITGDNQSDSRSTNLNQNNININLLRIYNTAIDFINEDFSLITIKYINVLPLERRLELAREDMEKSMNTILVRVLDQETRDRIELKSREIMNNQMNILRIGIIPSTRESKAYKH